MAEMAFHGYNFGFMLFRHCHTLVGIRENTVLGGREYQLNIKKNMSVKNITR